MIFAEKYIDRHSHIYGILLLISYMIFVVFTGFIRYDRYGQNRRIPLLQTLHSFGAAENRRGR